MSLADACLVRLSELHAECQVFTLDTDFRRYRRHGRQTIPLLAPVGVSINLFVRKPKVLVK